MFEKHSNGKWHLIQNQPLLREIYKGPPLISYRKGKSLKDMLVKTIRVVINTMGTQRGSRSLSTPFKHDLTSSEKQTVTFFVTE